MTDPDPAYPDPETRAALEPGCARCSDLAASRTRISWGNGPPDADVVVVGEAPGSGDPDADRWRGGNHTGLAYTSRHSGRRVRATLAAVGYGDRAYYTNAVKCFPRADEDTAGGEPTNREPTPDERANCRPHLRAELDAVEPAVVLPTGKHATASVFALAGRELDGFLDAVLEPVEWPERSARIVPILHPSYRDVWRSRLGYTAEEYRDAVAAELP